MENRATETILVQTWNYKVTKRYFQFEYMVFRNNKLVQNCGYCSSHSRDPRTIKKLLKSGWATELALQSAF